MGGAGQRFTRSLLPPARPQMEGAAAPEGASSSGVSLGTLVALLFTTNLCVAAFSTAISKANNARKAPHTGVNHPATHPHVGTNNTPALVDQASSERGAWVRGLGGVSKLVFRNSEYMPVAETELTFHHPQAFQDGCPEAGYQSRAPHTATLSL